MQHGKGATPVDATRFDEIVRFFATTHSRRRVLTGLIGSVLGLTGVERSAARTCSLPGAICREDANCCSSVCGPGDRPGRQVCRCRSIADCPESRDACEVVNCDEGTCLTTRIICEPDDACHTAQCQPTTGECLVTPIACTPSDACSVATCNQTTGECESAPKACVPRDRCHTAACDLATGDCVQTPIACEASDTCHEATCDPETGSCSERAIVVCANGSCCDGACVDTETDPRNCGECGHLCALGENCRQGLCFCGETDSLCAFYGMMCCDDICRCEGRGKYLSYETCGLVSSCPPGSTPCEGNTGCGRETRVCCPGGTSCHPTKPVCYPD